MQGARENLHNGWQIRKMSVGVDAALSPAMRNRKIAGIFSETVKCSVGADDPVRPWGNDKFAATVRKNGRASYGSMRRPQASFEAQPRAARLLAPKMGIDPYKRCTISHWYIRIRGCAPPGGQRRPPLQVRACPHGCIQTCGVVPCGRGKPRPYVTTKRGGSSEITTLPLISRLRRQLPPRGKPWCGASRAVSYDLNSCV